MRVSSICHSEIHLYITYLSTFMRNISNYVYIKYIKLWDKGVCEALMPRRAAILEMIDFEREGTMNEKASSQGMYMWNTKALPQTVQK